MNPATARDSSSDVPKRFARFPFTCAACGREEKDVTTRQVPIAWSRHAGERGKVWHWECRPTADAPRDRSDDQEPATTLEPASVPRAVAALDVPTPGTLEGLIASAVAPLLDGKIRAGLDADAVNALIDAKISALAGPRTLVVEHADTGERVDVGLVHKRFPELLGLVRLRRHVYLYGPPGTSKSTSAGLVAKALGLTFAHCSLNPQTPESRLLGFMHANGGYVGTPFRAAYQHGGVMSLEELDNGHPALQNTLNTLLENGSGAFPDGMVERHPDFVLVANGNTTGHGGDVHHPERRAFDSAFRERFCVLAWELDEDLEAACVDAIGGPQARPWLQWVRTLRAHAATHAPRLIVSPRASIVGATLLRDLGWPPAFVAEVAIYKGADVASTCARACPFGSDLA